LLPGPEKDGEQFLFLCPYFDAINLYFWRFMLTSSPSQTVEADSDFPFSDEFDVLVIGAGAAGLYTALCLPPQFKIGLITKEPLSLSASDWAQGGIAAPISPQDSPEFHIQDTLQAGSGLCDRRAVQFLVEHAPGCIQSLVDMGVGFDRHQGELALTLEAAHSHRRVLHAADTTGRAVVSTLANHVMKRPNIQVISAFTLDLWLAAEPNQRCQGVSLLYQEQIIWVRATAVILATGGGGQVFAQTTNPVLSTGDGVAIAHRSGAILRDLEFVQFHPTALTKPGAPRFLISEAVRGEGAHLVDDQGHRFAFDYHPSGELAPRDVVSRAIFSYLQKTGGDPANAHVWLDLRPIPADRIQQRFPNIIRVCQRWGIDVFQEPIPVAPAAHYWMGGIATDVLNHTSIPGLYAVGETASTGVHGANRLASNSLLECLVFGGQFAQFEVEARTRSQESEVRSQNGEWGTGNGEGMGREWERELERVAEMRQELPRLIWQSAGICREGAQMKGAISQVDAWQEEFNHLAISQTLGHLSPRQRLSPKRPDSNRPDPDLKMSNNAPSLRTWAETRNLLDVGALILRSALFRTESRGGHYRTDHPQTDSAWQVHTLVQRNTLEPPLEQNQLGQNQTRWWTEAVDG
jgi:L-aspartate oxidase